MTNVGPIIFLHIPKTGGTTFRNILTSIYPDAKIHTHFDQKKTIDLACKIKEFDLICGHFYAQPIAQSQGTFLTILRHPAHRIASHYYYALRSPNHYLHDIVKSYRMTLEDYAMSGLSLELDNDQTRMLAGSSWDTVCDEKNLQQAIHNLQHSFLAYGILEKFTETMDLFKRKLGWKNVPVYEKTNHHPEPKEIQNSTIDLISARNSLDMRLHNWALLHFGAQV